MIYLLAGLAIFLAVHSVRLVAEDWRTHMQQRFGVSAWRGLYSLLSLIGLGLTVWGFGLVRQAPVQWWSPPTGMRHLAAMLTLVSFVLLAAAYVPGNQIKARVKHPMVAGIALWAVAHLLSNGNAGQVVLFGSFLLWAVPAYVAGCRRDFRHGVEQPAGQAGATGITVALGVAAWMAFALWLHGWLIGVRPLG